MHINLLIKEVFVYANTLYNCLAVILNKINIIINIPKHDFFGFRE